MDSPENKSSSSRMASQRTIEKRGRSRDLDRITRPTPNPQLPTPETVRRPSKTNLNPTDRPTEQTQLPTPQSLVRHSRKESLTRASQLDSVLTEDGTDTPPSPSGHTTFFLSSTHASYPDPGESKRLRRRPGLTFAQQMGFLPGGSARLGVGIGGAKSGVQKVDQIRFDPTAKRSGSEEEENPFLVSGPPLASPGTYTIHRPGQYGDIHSSSSPRQRGQKTLRSPAKLGLPVTSTLLTPPTTQQTRRIATPPQLPGSPTTASRQAATERKARLEALRREKEEQARRTAEEAKRKEEDARKEKIMQMMDEDENPFLVKPGSTSKRRTEPVVDETRPTVTYVFRGSKKVFANPFIGSEARLPEAELDVRDPDFEPHPCPPPRLLWPTGPTPAEASSSKLSTPPGLPELTTPRTRRRARIAAKSTSPPSSPVRTPDFEEDFEDETAHGPQNVFTSDEEFVPEGAVSEDEEVPVRRGMLFSREIAAARAAKPEGGFTISGTGDDEKPRTTKRISDGHVGGGGKKAKTVKGLRM